MAPPESDEEKAQYLRAIFDTIPAPVFIVDADVCIHDFNTTAEMFLGEEPAASLHKRGGEAFHCIHSVARGCGRSPRCRDCAIRNSVQRALEGIPASRIEHEAEVRSAKGTTTIELLVTASLLPYTKLPMVLLILEDVSHLVHRRRRRSTVRQAKRPRPHSAAS